MKSHTERPSAGRHGGEFLENVKNTFYTNDKKKKKRKNPLQTVDTPKISFLVEQIFSGYLPPLTFGYVTRIAPLRSEKCVRTPREGDGQYSTVTNCRKRRTTIITPTLAVSANVRCSSATAARNYYALRPYDLLSSTCYPSVLSSNRVGGRSQ